MFIARVFPMEAATNGSADAVEAQRVQQRGCGFGGECVSRFVQYVLTDIRSESNFLAMFHLLKMDWTVEKCI